MALRFVARPSAHATLASRTPFLRSPVVGSLRSRGHFAFADDSSNCVTDATTRSIVRAAAGGGANSGGSSGSGGGGGGSSSSGGSDSHPMRLWTYLFAALLAAGGIMGYVKGRSTKSLTAGGSAAVILALCARGMAGPAAANAVRIAFALSLVLGMVMLSRFQRSRKLMPAGVLAGVSLLMSGGYILNGL